MPLSSQTEVEAHLVRQAAGVIRDYRKVVQGVQEPDTRWQLIRIGAKGQSDVATIHWHSASVHHHKTYILAAVNYDSIACSPMRRTGSHSMVPLQEPRSHIMHLEHRPSKSGSLGQSAVSDQRMKPYVH